MSGSRRTRKPVGAPAAPRSRRGGGARRLGLLVAGLVVAGATAWLALRPRGTAPGPAASLSAHEVLDRAHAAEARQDFAAAFALYRDAMRRYPNQPQLVGSYAAAISQQSFAVVASRGRLVPLAATSHERVTTALQALALLDAAERLDPRAGEPALQRGLTYASWGLPEDALAELYRAHLLGGRPAEIDRIGTAITLLQLGRGGEVAAGGTPARP